MVYIKSNGNKVFKLQCFTELDSLLIVKKLVNVVETQRLKVCLNEYFETLIGMQYTIECVVNHILSVDKGARGNNEVHLGLNLYFA